MCSIKRDTTTPGPCGPKVRVNSETTIPSVLHLLEPGPMRPQVSERPVPLLPTARPKLRERVLGHDVSIRQLLHSEQPVHAPRVRPVFQDPLAGFEEHGGGHRAIGGSPREADMSVGMRCLVDGQRLEDGDVSGRVAVGRERRGEEGEQGVALGGRKSRICGSEREEERN